MKRQDLRRGDILRDPKLCPTCGRKAETVVGARGYCNACARTMRLFLGEREGDAAALAVQV
jgi:predicted amidophosphoribosyltransferase